jgi:hypothetical protein
MKLLDTFTRLFGAAAAPSKVSGPALPPQPPPKATPKQTSTPPFYPVQTPSPGSRLLAKDRGLANSDILQLRYGASTNVTLRDLAAASPDLSAALAANLRLGITESYILKCWNPDGSFNADGTRLAYQLLQRMDLVPDYTQGFNQVNSLLATSESLAKDLLTYGGMAMELVLDKSRLPTRFVPLSSSQIVFFPDPASKGVVPKQLIAGSYIDLDLPTFFWVSIDQDLLSAYPTSPFEAAIQPVIADSEFTNDMRRVVKRAAYPRLDVEVDEELLRQSIPPDVLSDTDKLTAYRNTVTQTIADVINGLAPEDALVHYSFVKVKYVDGGTTPVQDVFKGVQDLINAKLSTGAKTLPSVLGHGSGSQNVASSETLLAMKTADGMVRRKLNEMYSKAFTLAVRLFGLDVSVEFTYRPINLRPTIEVEAFEAMRQSRILEQLSFGLISDEEACLELTGNLPPAGMTPLSGTMFSAGIGKGGENAYSGTSTGGNGGGLNQAITSNAPKGKKGAG